MEDEERGKCGVIVINTVLWRHMTSEVIILGKP